MTLNGDMVLFCVILPNLVVSGAHCVNVVDRAMNIVVLYLVKVMPFNSRKLNSV